MQIPHHVSLMASQITRKVIVFQWLLLAYMLQCSASALFQVMACRLFGAKPLPEPVLAHCQLDSWELLSVKFEFEFYHFQENKFETVVCPNGSHFVQEGRWVKGIHQWLVESSRKGLVMPRHLQLFSTSSWMKGNGCNISQGMTNHQDPIWDHFSTRAHHVPA